jgi:hypothetical protein
LKEYQVIKQIFILYIVNAEIVPEFNIRKRLRIPKYGNFQTLLNSTLNHKRISAYEHTALSSTASFTSLLVYYAPTDVGQLKAIISRPGENPYRRAENIKSRN